MFKGKSSESSCQACSCRERSRCFRGNVCPSDPLLRQTHAGDTCCGAAAGSMARGVRELWLPAALVTLVSSLVLAGSEAPLGLSTGIIIMCSHHLSHHATDDSKTISRKSSCPALVLLQGPGRPHASRPRCYLHFHGTADPVAMPKPMFDGADPIRIFFKSTFNEKNLFFSAWSAGTAAKARITKAN